MEYVHVEAVVMACGPGRPSTATPPVWALALLLLAQPALSGFSGPVWPHKEGGKTPGPGPAGFGQPPPPPGPGGSTLLPLGRPAPSTPPPPPGPEFDTSDIPTTVQARPGQTVFLPCRVKHRGDNVVLWMRTEPIQVLTHGETVFASSLRFSVWHGGGGDAWTLKVSGVRPEDSGRYECQVNTDPKMSLAIVLQVQEDFRDFPSDQQHIDAPTPDDGGATVAGPRYVPQGTTVTFTCVADAPGPGEAGALAASMVEWRYNGDLVSTQMGRGGVSVETERDDQKIRSTLTLAAVSASDAGTYSCAPAGARPGTIQLIVVDGERMEAMHRGDAGRLSPSAPVLALLAATLLASARAA